MTRRHATAEWWMERKQAETVPCRDRGGCGEPAGSTCVNAITGEPLTHAPAHPVRIHDAEEHPA